MLNHPRLALLALPLGLIGLAAAPSLVNEFDRIARLHSMPIEQRRSLSDNLDRFDHLDRAEKEALLKLDTLLAARPPDERARYLDLLRRYHLWFQSLNEPERKELSEASIPGRLSLVRDLREGERKGLEAGPREEPIWSLSGVFNPASFGEEAHQIRIWRTLDADKQSELAAIHDEHRRMIRIEHLGRDRAHPGPDREKPMEGAVLRRQVITHLEAGRADEAEKLLRQMRHRQDLHFRRNPPPFVEPHELARFEAGLPTWIRERIAAFPPEAARSRLMILHYLIYNAPAGVASARSQPAPTRPERPVPPASSPSSAPPLPHAKAGPRAFLLPSRSAGRTTQRTDFPWTTPT